MFPEDTIAAISTPLGESGIGIVRLSGSKAIDIVSQVYRNTKPLPIQDRLSHTVHHGQIFDPQINEEIDEVLVTLMRAPHSYTTEDVVEISAHGGIIVLQRILQLTLSHGARLAEPGEFTKRAFLAGRIDLTQAEAVIDLIQSQTELAQRCAIQQLEGRLSEQIRNISNSLMDILTELEAHIDFPEEDIPQEIKLKVISTIRQSKNSVVTLLNSARFGRKIREGVKVPIVGKPNVGKSSLLNAFVQEARAIVTPHPGTTRDTIHEFVNIAGIPFEFIDTAGWRKTDDVIEREGVRRTQAAVANADLVLLVFDGTTPVTDEDQDIITAVKKREMPFIAVINKIDLPTILDAPRLKSILPTIPFISISALTGQGLPQLKETLQSTIISSELVSSADSIFVTNIRHADLLKKSLNSVTAVETGMQKDAPPEVIAAELRVALSNLGEILGTNVTADLLSRIFSRFCIGK